MKISNEQIIQSARRQRQSVESRIDVEPWRLRRRQGRSLAAIIAVAASFVSFIAGYGLHASMPQPNEQLMAQAVITQAVQVEHDTIYQTQTIRDTIYQTRIVTKYEPMLAANEEKLTTNPLDINEQMACSMLCDDIPYDLLAAP